MLSRLQLVVLALALCLLQVTTSQLSETFDRDERSPKQKFIRFGRAGSARFIRFGRSSPDLWDESKGSSEIDEMKRAGPRFIRFG
uniref:Uncharacterized protein n=2 Tax=Ascaris TaxID=6251 RepID=A0A9J2PMQ8_ASCLU|nr:AFP-15 [Ascaris suum]